MFRWLFRTLGWLLSLLVRLAFVVAVVVFAASIAFGGLPVDGGVGDLLGDLGVPADVGDIGALGAADNDSASGVGGIGSIVDDEADGSGGTAGAGTNASTVSASETSELNGTELEYLVHRNVNEERAERGKSNLSFDTDLRPVARYHSTDMANRSYFSHVGPDGETLADRYQRFDYQCRVKTGTLRYATGGENILYTYYDAPVSMDNRTVQYDSQEELARGIVNGWMNSTSHRKNLLKPYWENEAIGVHIEQIDGRTRVYATQNFC
ncbi:CAP domain-containing protein [Halococcus dombrowskii]|uniref:CAP domain-containing protein n=2 Tax=Halococcus dombrowskii TaxID=179637 RepID=A0AAV3SKK4_HALDO|nr:CAP domain-containing protein [Halococcus dombrowskii]UOO94231.1 CAP domain-containing protein [Halococcus dombrowskii]